MADKEVKVSRRREKARGLLSKFNFNKSDILLLWITAWFRLHFTAVRQIENCKISVT